MMGIHGFAIALPMTAKIYRYIPQRIKSKLCRGFFQVSITMKTVHGLNLADKGRFLHYRKDLWPICLHGTTDFWILEKK